MADPDERLRHGWALVYRDEHERAQLVVGELIGVSGTKVEILIRPRPETDKLTILLGSLLGWKRSEQGSYLYDDKSAIERLAEWARADYGAELSPLVSFEPWPHVVYE
jgi:hypothetical protein